MNCQILHGDSRKASKLPFKELEEGKLGIYNVSASDEKFRVVNDFTEYHKAFCLLFQN
jgi:hypothetical protein